jgi:hypothetical protein
MQFWSAEQLAIEISGPQGNSEVVVPHPYALVGALAKADVRVAGQGAQKRDLLLVATSGKLICRRLEAPLPEAYRELQPGDWLELGEFRLRCRIVASPPDLREEPDPAQAEVKSRIPVLRVRHKRRPSVNRRLYADVQLVGRAPDCEVELRSPEASLYHCALVRDINGLWCIDLGSGNGTYLNGRRIDCALVELGGRLKVGDFEMEFQRFSRRSASASGLSENTAGSKLSLGPLSLADDMHGEAAPRGSRIGAPPSDSVFGSKIIDSTAEVIAPTLSGLTTLPPLPAVELEHLEARQVEFMAQQTELRHGLAALREENARLQSAQEALAQLPQRLDEQWAALLAELKQQAQADRETLSTDLPGRLEELRRSQAQELSTSIDSQRQSLSHELQKGLEDFRQSEAQELSSRMESLQQSLSQELLGRLEEARQTDAQELLARIESLRQTLSQELQGRLAELHDSQASELATSIDAKLKSLSQDLLARLETLGNSHSEQLASQASAQRQAISDEQLQRLDDLAKTQAQHLKLQFDAQRHALTQELTRRLETELEGRVQQPPTASDPAQQMVSQQWLQRLDDVRKAQSEEIALAVTTQGQALSEELVQRLEELHKAQAQKLAGQMEQQRQLLSQELARQLEAQGAQSRELLERTASQRQEELQQSLSQELARQVEAQVAQSRETLAKLKSQRQEEQQSQARQIAVQIEQQRQMLSHELAQQLEAQAAQARELLAQSAGQRQESQAQHVAAEIEQQRQSLSQELTRQLEAQQAALARELLAQLESQRAALLTEQQAYEEAVAQRLQPLLTSLDQLVSQQSQLSSSLARQAEQNQATRRALLELQSRVDQQRDVPTSQPEDDEPMFEADEREPQASIAALDSDIHEALEPAPSSEIAVLPRSAPAADSSMERPALERKPAPIAEDDRLLHFVSDRLAEMDSGRQRWMAIYWAIAIGSVGIVGVAAWALWSWLSGQPAGN